MKSYHSTRRRRPTDRGSESISLRLQKVLAGAGVASRRAAERLIAQGRVTVNGQIVTTPGSRADPAHDVVKVDGRRIGGEQHRRYVLVNKPVGYVTTRHDPQRRRTVLDLIPTVREYVYPVGRLDYDSEGLLLLTNDGELAARLMHPRHHLERVYDVIICGVPTESALRRLATGVWLDDRRTTPAAVRLMGGRRTHGAGEARVRITLREGRHRQVRRMCAAIGHRVVRLRRVRFGPLRLRGLTVGQARTLTEAEVAALRRAVEQD